MSNRRRGAWTIATIAVLAACTFAGSALAPAGSSRATGPFAVERLAGKSAPNPLAGRLHKVYGTNIPASRYGTEIADLEDSGTNLAGEQVSDLSPVPASAFTAPEDEYRAYSEGWIARAIADALVLEHALVRGDRTAAMAAWGATWSDYRGALPTRASPAFTASKWAFGPAKACPH
jgi:hypothetical protein